MKNNLPSPKKYLLNISIILSLAFILQTGFIERIAAIDFHPERPVKIVAHRGANKFAPQNSIPGIELAIKMGLDYVEMDVRQTKDGEMVIMHNSTVDATTDGKGEVKELTLDEIKKLDAGIKFRPKFKGTRVPTFREALQAAKGKINIYIDFKAGDPKKLVDLVNEFGMADDVVLYAGLNEMIEVQKLEPRIKGLPGVDSVEKLRLLKKTIDLRTIEMNMATPDKQLIKEAHESGIKVFMDILGFSDGREGLKKALALGVDAVQTDNPDMVLKYFEKNPPAVVK